MGQSTPLLTASRKPVNNSDDDGADESSSDGFEAMCPFDSTPEHRCLDCVVKNYDAIPSVPRCARCKTHGFKNEYDTKAPRYIEKEMIRKHLWSGDAAHKYYTDCDSVTVKKSRYSTALCYAFGGVAYNGEGDQVENQFMDLPGVVHVGKYWYTFDCAALDAVPQYGDEGDYDNWALANGEGLVGDQCDAESVDHGSDSVERDGDEQAADSSEEQDYWDK